MANDYLKEQVDQMSRSIDAVHKEFRGIVVPPELTNKVVEVGTNLTALRTNLATPAQSPLVISMYAERLQKALGELAELNAKYMPKHPLVESKQIEVDNLKKQLNDASPNSSPLATHVTPLPGRPGETNPELDIIRTKLLALEEGRVQIANRQREAGRSNFGQT